ncbi:maturase, partial [Escherichia coli]|uniref:maturase n=1 Tax=Escherichia coli TaxID=562 RepID=UPI00287A0199
MMINEAQAQATATSGRGDGQYPSGLHDGAEISTAAGGQTKAEVPLTMEAEITRENLMLAYQRVVENKGTAGVDNLSVAELKPWLKKNWRSVRQALIDGNYQPRTIRRMDIPKPDGGVRTSGIPTVVDRLIQQAVQQAQRYILGGKRWVEDMELKKCFDRVEHRLLMTRLARTIKDS